MVEALIAAGADLEARDDDGETALIAASESGRGLKVVHVLLAAGSDLEARGDAGRTALIAATRARGSMMLEALLVAGADLGARNRGGALAAQIAAITDATASPRSRMPGGFLGLQFDDTNEWSLAAELTVVQALVAAGADPRVRDAQGATPLMHAAGYSSNPKMVEVLVTAGSELDALDIAGRSALMWAAAFASSSEVVEVLLDLGADASLKSHAGETACDLIQDNEALQGASAYRRLRSLTDRP